MISKGKAKTAAEKRWLESVVDFATESSWLEMKYGLEVLDARSFEIDHILGAQAKRKVMGVTTKVGEYAIMPIPYEIHNIRSAHPLNRTLSPSAYRNQFGHEKNVWLEMVEAMRADGYYEMPFTDLIINSIVKG
ncbi:MAG: hypothetical protein ACPHUL_00195 [Marinomonas gallaica]